MKRTPLNKRGKRAKRMDPLDREAKKLCRERANGLCEVTGKIGTDVHHMICCDDLEWRWRQENLVLLSREAHRDVDTPGGRARMWAWFKANRPEDYAVIGHRAREVVA